jgi:hypothetical protein
VKRNVFLRSEARQASQAANKSLQMLLEDYSACAGPETALTDISVAATQA